MMFTPLSGRTNPLVLADADAELAETIRKAMQAANALEAHAPQSRTYGALALALQECLTVAFRTDEGGAGADAEDVYAVMLDSGVTVPEAVASLNETRAARKAEADAEYAEILALAGGNPWRVPEVERVLSTY